MTAAQSNQDSGYCQHDYQAVDQESSAGLFLASFHLYFLPWTHAAGERRNTVLTTTAASATRVSPTNSGQAGREVDVVGRVGHGVGEGVVVGVGGSGVGV